ncbi:acyl-CoA N-acyltransferase [Calocera cornea HHB12733]|uniref:Acyl-CoA N-acyltransferase n=1 Tax=Calocera cornea HHB12733 TaxID=1353952 RepID=A0A165I2M5_9BASI|nr:acyl-CoA N-acyltransferase [Calocera cornea HHB12733]
MIPFATTKHLTLRAVRDSDKDAVFSLMNDQRVAFGNNEGWHVPVSDMMWEAAKPQLLQSQLLLAVVEIKREFVGGLNLHLAQPKDRDTDLGISLAFAWWGKGLGTELLQWALEHNFTQLNMHRMSLGVFGDNERAIELYKYLGFVEEGRVREGRCREGGAWVDFVRMGMLDREWQARKDQLGSTAQFDDVVVSTVSSFI